MATLREQIQAAIELKAGDPTAAAVEVCKVLEDQIGLSGNGWFDDDPVMEQALKSHDN